MPPALPGFYYDAEKKKYFKIQLNHVAAHGSTSKYSRAAVKKEAEEQLEQKRRKSFEQRERKMRVKRSRVLESPLGGGWGVTRELGITKFESSTIMRAWAQGLRRKEVSTSRNQDGDSGIFVFDIALGILTHAEMLGGHGANASFSVKHIVPPARDLGRESWVELGAMSSGHIFDSQVTSMDISLSRVLMTTTMGGSQPACVHLTKLIEPEEWRVRYQDYMSTRSHERDNDPLSYTSDVSTVIRSQMNATFWAASVRPDPTISDFAIATTYGTVIVAESQSSWSFDRIQTFKYEDFDASSEVLAVDWLDTNVLLNGCRDGTVRLWDARTYGTSGTSLRIKHPSCINHVRKVDRNKVVVAGLDRQMAGYDLRYIRPKDFDTAGTTRPFVEYPGYKNKELNGVAMGFDVCGDLVAAGTDEGEVQIFNVASGREVTMGKGGDMGKKLGGPARCLRFVEMEERGDGRRLFVAGGRGIEQWAW